MDTSRKLLQYAKESEDVAAGLRRFRDDLPRSATKITAAIAELYLISAVLREINGSRSSFRHVEDDLDLVFQTLQRTLERAFDMFAKSREYEPGVLWQQLCDRMERDEGIGLPERLEWYHSFLLAQRDILTGYQPRERGQMRSQLRSLLDTQVIPFERDRRRAINEPGPSRPFRPNRPNLPRTEIPRQPRQPGEDWERYYRRTSMTPPVVPEVPMPTSPTFTSGSSQTMNSSQTSYSSDTAFARPRPALVHWCQDVFDGGNPGTLFLAPHQRNELSACYGDVDDRAIHRLRQDGFVKAIELTFDHDALNLEIFFRQHDSRSRLLVITQNSSGRPLLFSTYLTNLKVIRDGSTLKLCRLRREGVFRIWAKLNFVLYERMVLFYCTFVAMKRQDSRGLDHVDLLDEFELEGKPEDPYEEPLFGSIVKDGRMQHNLRLYQDGASGVVRLEASAHSGPMENVPLWTAFVTRYAKQGDIAWASYVGDGIVNLAAIRPPPYVFLGSYGPPKNNLDEYLLHFISDRDAKYFCEQWTALCSTY